MQFHILDENYTPVAVMDNELPDAIHLNESKFHRFLTGSADFLDFETSKLHIDHKLLQVGYWIAFKYNGRDHLLYITEIAEAERDKMMSISSMSLNLDLNLENMMPFSADTGHSFAWYFDRIMFDTGYEIGVNEISNLSRKLSWDSEMSRRAFLQSVATQFDNAELDYEVILNSDFTIRKRLVHIKKKIGEVRDDIELRYGDNIKTIKRSTNIDNLYTAIKPISKDDSGKITDISSVADWQKLDELGNVKFYHKKGSPHILAPQANARFGNRGANVNVNGGYIVRDYSYDKISQSELFNRGAALLEEISVPAVNYEVEGQTGARIGDTVKIVDDGYTPQLLLEARVHEQIISFDDVTLEQSVLGNYKALESQVSDDLISKMQQLAEQNAPYKTQTLSTNGLVFKNSEGSTTLTARLYKGIKEVAPDSYHWTLDGESLQIDGNQYEITADDIDGKSVVRWSAVIADVIVAYDEVTIVDVSDGKQGEDGKPTGITQSNIEPTETYEGMLWQYTGADDLPLEGTTAVPQATYVSIDEKWETLGLPPENINAPDLAKISKDLGDITAGTYTLWNSYDGDVYEYLSGVYISDAHVKTIVIENPSTTNPDTAIVAKGVAVRGTDMYAGMISTYMGIINSTATANELLKGASFWSQANLCGSITSYMYTTGGQITLTANEIKVVGDLRNNNIIKDWTTISTGYGTNARPDLNNPLQYKVERNTNGTRKVTFRGNIASISGNLPQSVVLILPVDARPSANGISFPCMGNSARLARIVIDSTGGVGYNVAYGSTDMQSVSLSPVWYDVE